jgi:type I restriction-modification system DNA methylase subunit
LQSSLTEFEEDLQKLIAKFENDKAYYVSKDYSEAQARVDFIDPFFRALGWDVENQAGLPHHEREVLVEKGDVDTEGRPDYNFRTNGRTRFFVEAKAPSERLDETRHIIQAKTYAWNTKSVFFVILTDFEELRFYDASITPDERKPDEGLLAKLHYAEYLASAEKLWEFSRERVAAGSLDAMLPRDRRTQRLRIPVDQAFLDEMTGWRAALARNVYKNNRGLSAKQLNEVVQRLLDRIIFIRIAEDRRIVEKRQLADAVDEWKARGGKISLFEWLGPLFENINEDFNGDIFKPNELLDEAKASSEVLARIIERLYPPKSPYRFNVLGVELLGSVYERYLGNTIRTTAHQVRVEEKAEVRHAGGVYYTPKYIVDYIVKNAVGKIIEDKSPKQIEKIRILDPACGSGSFLIGAFQYLIDYHIRWYVAHPEHEVRHAHPSLDFMREVHKGPDGGDVLSPYRKKRILRNNLFGVDIDPQAVEITKMSLYVKALEGESPKWRSKEQVLPELRYNIQCGNSLISKEEVDEQRTFFGDTDRDRINAFTWQEGFPEIMESGGFDVVVGNPPYIRVQVMQEWAPFEVEFYKERYKAASYGNYDIYVVFVEKGLSLLKKGGRLGYILPHKFFNAMYGEPLRSLIAEGKHLSEIIHFGDQQVFDGATNYTCLLFLQKDGKEKFQFAKVDDLEAWRNGGKAVVGMIRADRATASDWNFAVGEAAALLEKLRKMPVKLGDVADRIFQGLVTGADPVFILGNRSPDRFFSEATGETHRIESRLMHPLCKGSVNLRRYHVAEITKSILFPYKLEGHAARLLSTKEFKDQFPGAWGYLQANRRALESREGGKWRNERWYAFGRTQNLAEMEQKKILTPSIANEASFTLDTGDYYYFVGSGGGGGGGYGVTLKSSEDLAHEYVLGLLNSKLIDTYLKSLSSLFRGGYYAYNRQYIEQLPIRTINFSDRKDKARHDKMVSLVEQMLELNKKKHSGRLAPSELEEVERDIAATDAEIDNLVYELYGITDEERKIIEGA